MKLPSMTTVHRAAAPWVWLLGRAAATRIDAEPRPRWLLVTAGRVWLTETGRGPDDADVWLQAGERHLLPAGTEWVAEGWPEASIELLEEPLCAARKVSASRRWRVWPPALSAA